MRIIACQCLLAICLICFASAEDVHESSAAIKKKIVKVVEGQLAAFRANDFAKGYSFASTEIKSLYSAEDFESMVRKSFPAIARSSSSECGSALDTGEEALVDVHVRGAEGISSGDFRYRLHKEGDQWRITGVIEIKPTGLTV